MKTLTHHQPTYQYTGRREWFSCDLKVFEHGHRQVIMLTEQVGAYNGKILNPIYDSRVKPRLIEGAFIRCLNREFPDHTDVVHCIPAGKDGRDEELFKVVQEERRAEDAAFFGSPYRIRLYPITRAELEEIIGCKFEDWYEYEAKS